jgi:two-component system, NarL family, nitrate/nitrite response regulator NarL
MRLVLCDDHRLLTEALAAVLSSHGHVVEAIVFEPEEAVRAVAASDPDVCLLDLTFDGAMDGIAAARRLRDEHPRTKVLVLSAATEPSTVAAAIDAGVAGFTRKDQSATALLTTLDRVEAGEMAIDGDLLRAAIRGAMPAAQNDAGRLLSFLTAQERTVLLLLVDGHSTAEIAQSLDVATSTARTHVQNVLMKMGAHSRLQAAAMVVNGGLLDTLRMTTARRSPAPG